MTFADRIKQLRKDHGLTQEDLAAKAGLGIATIQRAERGERPSADTISSIASAFNLTALALTSASKPTSAEPTEASYLSLAEITSGKELVDLVVTCSAIDFDYMEIQDATIGDLLGRLYELCRPRENFPDSPSDRIRLDIEAAKLLSELKGKGLTVSGETYIRTGYQVDETYALPLLLDQWDETCLVLRGVRAVLSLTARTSKRACLKIAAKFALCTTRAMCALCAQRRRRCRLTTKLHFSDVTALTFPSPPAHLRGIADGHQRRRLGPRNCPRPQGICRRSRP
jgi:transcriptional regulator with XRE-family HTH domain